MVSITRRSSVQIRPPQPFNISFQQLPNFQRLLDELQGSLNNSDKDEISKSEEDYKVIDKVELAQKLLEIMEQENIEAPILKKVA